MAENHNWNVNPATDIDGLANVLFAASSGLKTQVIRSPVLAEPRFAALRQRLSQIADELHGLQQDMFIG